MLQQKSLKILVIDAGKSSSKIEDVLRAASKQRTSSDRGGLVIQKTTYRSLNWKMCFTADVFIIATEAYSKALGVEKIIKSLLAAFDTFDHDEKKKEKFFEALKTRTVFYSEGPTNNGEAPFNKKDGRYIFGSPHFYPPWKGEYDALKKYFAKIYFEDPRNTGGQKRITENLSKQIKST